MKEENEKSELSKAERSEVPSYTPELGTRISIAIERIGGLRAAEKFAGASEDTIANWRDGKSRPNFYGILGLARAAKIRIEWLADGAEPMESDFPKIEPTILQSDHRLYGRLTEKISQVYKEMGVAIALHQVAELAAKEHDRIVAMVADPDDRLTEVGEVTAALRQELRAAADDPASSKRRA